MIEISLVVTPRTLWHEINLLQDTMRAQYTFESIDGRPTMFLEDQQVDQHYKAEGHDEYIQKCAYLLFRKVGWDGQQATANTEVAAMYTDKYLKINGELAITYLMWLPAETAEQHWNGALARTLAYNDYKKLIVAGFHNNMAANTAYHHHLMLINPDCAEIMQILGIQKIGE